jgi:hypothetical protein
MFVYGLDSIGKMWFVFIVLALEVPDWFVGPLECFSWFHSIYLIYLYISFA